jgi:cell division septal protein FtsQ
MTAAWNHSPKHRKPVRDFHRQRYGNPLFPQKQGSHVLRHATVRPQRHRQTAKLPSFGSIFGTLGAVAVCGIAWYVIWSPAFRMNDVLMQGASASTEQTVRQALDGYENGYSLMVLPRNNVLFFSEQAAKTAIQKAIYLDGVDIQKKLPNTVFVTVKEKTTKAVLDRNGHLYALDDSGFALRELTGDEMAMMGDLPPGMDSVQVGQLDAQAADAATTSGVPSADPTDPAGSGTTSISAAVTDAQTTVPAKKVPPADAVAPATSQSAASTDAPVPNPNTNAPAMPAAAAPAAPAKNTWPLILDDAPADGSAPTPTVVPGTQVFSAPTLAIILESSARLPDIAGEPARWFVPDEASDSIDVTMASGWHIYFASSTPFDVQAQRLSVVLKQEIGDKKPNLLYIDLRYDERIFYRFKGDTQ